MTEATNSELRALLDFAVRLGREAGELANRYFKGSFVTERKADQTLVTTADREVESFLRDSIQRAFPDDGIRGEEQPEQIGTSGRRWILDPIDGTFSFVHGVPLYAVLVGLEINGKPVLGVANLPAIDEIVYAGRGLGCFWNGQTARVSSIHTLGEGLLLAPDVGPDDKEGFGPAIRRLQKMGPERRNWGDAYGHILVATGRAEIMLDPVVNVWDCAALLPILEEAGGTFTDWKGHRTIHGGSAISTNTLLLEQVMKVIRQHSS